MTATGGTITVSTSSGMTIHKFTSDGAFTVTSVSSSTTSTTTTARLQDLNYTYDADGNILTRTDSSDSGVGQKVTYTYDTLNRLLTASTTVSNENAYLQTFTYNELGNITSGPAGDYSYQGDTGSSYANPHAVTQISKRSGESDPTIEFDNSGIGGNGTPASSLTFSYTTNSNTDGLIIVSVEEATTSPSCTSDTVTGVTHNGDSLTDLGYYTSDPQGLALKTYYGYEPATSTHNIVVTASASCIRYAAAATYTGVKQSDMPDASGSGNPLSSSGLVELLQGTTTAGYNAWAIMTGVPSTAGTATAGPGTTIRQQQSGEIYYADLGGPVYGATGLSWSKSEADWAANFFSIAPLELNPGVVSTTTFAYDNNGNVIRVGTTTFYTYDYKNRLTQSDIWNGTATTTTTYAYGPFGERVSQTTDNTTIVYPNKYYSVKTTGTSATSTEFIFAGSNLLATIDQPLESGVATGTPVTRYNHTDHLGSTNVTSDDFMNVAQWFDYAPFGSVIASTNTGSTNAARQYIGQFADESNLLYLNARYMDPKEGPIP